MIFAGQNWHLWNLICQTCLLVPVLALCQLGPTNWVVAQVSPLTEAGVVPRAADRIRNEPDSVWVEFIQLALDYKPLNLGQGFPDFAAPAYLIESLQNASKQVDQTNILHHQYTRSFGHPRLVRALRDYYQKLRNFTQLTDEKDQILVTVGAYEALFAAIMAFVDPGDEVLIIEPAFDAYAPMVSMAGGKAVYLPLRLMNATNSKNTTRLGTEHYGLDMDEFERKVTDRTRVLVLNTPNNPLGKIYSRQELEQLASACMRHNLLVVADEVYEQFYYDANEHVSIASLPGMWSRTITIGSAGKTFSVTGWKIGWAYGPRHLVRYMQLVHQTAVYTVATPLQEAIARALENEIAINEADTQMTTDKASAQPSLAEACGSSQSAASLASGRVAFDCSCSTSSAPYWQQLRQELVCKRNRMAQILERAQMRPIVPQGGYFMLADFSQLAKLFPEYQNQTTSGAIQSNDYKFARWLSRVKHLQAIPGSAFYSDENKSLGGNLIRLCFIKRDETLNKFANLIDQLMLAGQ